MTSSTRNTETLGFPVAGVPQITNLFDDPNSRRLYTQLGDHPGIDFQTKDGETPICAMAGGTVIKTVTGETTGGTGRGTFNANEPYGNQVWIRTSVGDRHFYSYVNGTRTEGAASFNSFRPQCPQGRTALTRRRR